MTDRTEVVLIWIVMTTGFLLLKEAVEYVLREWRKRKIAAIQRLESGLSMQFRGNRRPRGNHNGPRQHQGRPRHTCGRTNDGTPPVIVNLANEVEGNRNWEQEFRSFLNKK